MNYTNKHGLPDAFYRVIIADPYTRGGSDFSATQLQNPPRAIVLLEQSPDIEVDISTRVAATIGQGVHSILERAKRPGDVIETRFHSPFSVEGTVYTVSAQVDLWEGDTRILYDWKTTKAYAFHKRSSGKDEWEAQLNIGAHLMEAEGYEVSGLKIIGLLKDWDHKKAKQEPGYPPTEIMELEIDKWTWEDTIDYITSRVSKILAARESLPRCTPAETWGGNRCIRWCDAASICEQYQQTKKTGLIGRGE